LRSTTYYNKIISNECKLVDRDHKMILTRTLSVSMEMTNKTSITNKKGVDVCMTVRIIPVGCVDVGLGMGVCGCGHGSSEGKKSSIPRCPHSQPYPPKRA
jgi:hypothetical protein